MAPSPSRTFLHDCTITQKGFGEGAEINTRGAYAPRKIARHAINLRGKIFAGMTERARHPDQFVEKPLHPAGVSGIGNFASRRIKELSCCAEIDVRENSDQAELTEHRQQTLDHARAAEWACRNTTNADCFVDVFLQVCIEDMFQQAWETVIVFRDHEDKSVSPRDPCRELAVFERFAGVIHRHRNFPDVDQFGFNIFAFRHFAENEISSGFGQAALPRCTDNDREKNGSSYILRSHVL